MTIDLKDVVDPLDNNIKAYFHCGLCLKELPAGISPGQWAMNEVGWTQFGLQVWCRRHEVNVVHIDFEGVKHSAWTNRKREGV